MKKKTYTPGEWALMIAAAILIVAGALGVSLMVLYFILKYAVYLHGEETETKKMAGAAFWAIAGGCLVLCAVSAAAGRKSRRLLKTWDGEESLQIDRMERFLDVLNYLFELFFVFLYMAAAFRSFAEMPGMGAPEKEWMYMGAYLIAFLLITVVLFAFQRMLRTAQNELAGESGGAYSNGIFSRKDLKEWREKSDEGERQIVYEAAFRAYRRTIHVLFFAMITVGCYMRLQTTVLVALFIAIGVVWIFMSANFCIERNRLRRKKVR